MLKCLLNFTNVRLSYATFLNAILSQCAIAIFSVKAFCLIYLINKRKIYTAIKLLAGLYYSCRYTYIVCRYFKHAGIISTHVYIFTHVYRVQCVNFFRHKRMWHVTWMQCRCFVSERERLIFVHVQEWLLWEWILVRRSFLSILKKILSLFKFINKVCV